MKTFKPYTPSQLFLLPPAPQEWLPEGHLALCIGDVVDQGLNLTPILAPDETAEGPGQPPYPPRCSCTGKPASRQIENITSQEIPPGSSQPTSTPTTPPAPPSARATSRPSPGAPPRSCSAATGRAW